MTQERNPGTAGPELLGGRYRVDALVGRGGMATVHRADDLMLGRTVAIKVFVDDPDVNAHAERKRSEMRALASLNHPSLVTVFDADIEAQPHPYLVMELVDGPALHERLASGPLPALEVATMARDLGEALAVVHAAGIVHRDIKPSNVLLTAGIAGRPSRAKLADFGIATIVDSTRLTVPGTLMGTAAYLAPEQLRDASPAAPADIYSLGLVVLESMTGVRAFPGTPAESMAARLVGDPVMPQSVPSPMRSLISSMTAADPADRPSALEVATTAGLVMKALEVDPESADDIATMPVVGAVGDAPTRLLAAPPTAPTVAMIPAEPVAPGGRAGAHRPWWRRRAAAVLGAVALIAAISIGVGVAVNDLAAPTAVALPVTDPPLSTHLDELLDAVAGAGLQEVVVDIAASAAAGDPATALALLDALELQVAQAGAEASTTAVIVLVRQDLQAMLDATTPADDDVAPVEPEPGEGDGNGNGNGGNGNGNGNGGNGNGNGNGNDKKDE